MNSGNPLGTGPYYILRASPSPIFARTSPIVLTREIWPLGWLQSTSGGGTRSSAATAYLAPQFQERANMHIVLNTRVTRILETTEASHAHTLRTVELKSASGMISLIPYS